MTRRRHPQPRGAGRRQDWPGATVVPDVDALLAHADELDLVVVASPTGEHVAHVPAALDAGLPVLVDKPLATTRRPTRELAGRRAPTGALTVFQNRRWDPEQLTLRGLLDRGRAGDACTGSSGAGSGSGPCRRTAGRRTTPSPAVCCSTSARTSSTPRSSCSGRSSRCTPSCTRCTTPAVDDVFLALVHARATGVVSHLQAGALVGAPGPRTRVLGRRAARTS